MSTTTAASRRLRFFVSSEFLDEFSRELGVGTARNAFVLKVLNRWDCKHRETPPEWTGRLELRLTLGERETAVLEELQGQGVCRQQWLMQAFALYRERVPRAGWSMKPAANESESVKVSPDDLSDEQIETLRERLLAMKQELVLKIRTMSTSAHERAEGDEADIATEQQSQIERHGMAERAKTQLNEVLAALRRIDEGEYGFCEETGDPIGWARLQANPTARLCIEAQHRREYGQRMLMAA